MFKTILFLLLFFLNIFSSCAQTLCGIEAGMSSNSLNTNIKNRTSSVIKSVIGYEVGIPIQNKIKKWLFLQSTPSFIQKNYSINRTDSLQGVFDQHNNTYFQIPLLLNFIYGNRLHFFANAGIYLGYWMMGRLKGETPNIFSVTNAGAGQQIETFQLTAYNQKYNFNSKIDNRIEFGWVAAVGLKYTFKKRIFIFLEYSYYQALTDQQKKYMINQIPQFNQTKTFSFGVSYDVK